MPELPEVETVCRGMDNTITGGIMTDVDIYRRDLRLPIPDNFEKAIKDAPIQSLDRIGKYIIMNFGSGRPRAVLHLGMSGRVKIVSGDHRVNREKHDHVILKAQTQNGIHQVIFNDARRFGFLRLSTSLDIRQDPLFKNIGPDCLTDAFTSDWLYQQSRGRKTNVKNFIMDQRIAAGMGNIYASESMFQAGIRPTRSIDRLTKKECQNLTIAIKDVLTRAVAAGGTTLKDHIMVNGDLGRFQHDLHAYGRDEEPCRQCDGQIKRIVQSNRASFYCPNCQK